MGLESVCRVGRCAINDTTKVRVKVARWSDNDKYSVERTRSYQFHFVMFSFACTHSSIRFLIRRARRATISRAYSFAYTRTPFVFERSYIPTTNTMTARSVAQVSLAFSRLRTLPSWISFASLVYLLQMLLPVGQPSCTHKSLMASTSILISCFLTVLIFHSFPLFQHRRHMLSRVIIIIPDHQACFVLS